jgi:hypothetical protein
MNYFFVLSRYYPLIFGKFFFAYDQRYSVEISTPTGVIDHANSEYEILFFSENSFQNPSTVTCHISADGQILKTDKYEYYQQVEDVITWNENNLVVLTKKTIHLHEIR